MTKSDYVQILRDSNEPTAEALIMLSAIRQHLADLEDDDPGDEEATFTERLAVAAATCEDFEQTLHTLAFGD